MDTTADKLLKQLWYALNEQGVALTQGQAWEAAGKLRDAKMATTAYFTGNQVYVDAYLSTLTPNQPTP